MAMQTTYGGGQATTNTQGLAGGGGAGMLFDPSVLGQLLNRRLKEREEDRAFEVQQRNRFKRQQTAEDTPSPLASPLAQASPLGRARIPEIGQQAYRPQIGSDKTAADAYLEDRERNARLLELQAASQPPPTRMVHGAGILSGRTLDPMAMNAYQRRMYLPESSQVIVPPSERTPSESLDEFDEGNRRARARAVGRMQQDRGSTGIVTTRGWR